jgi:hypothetical protein
LIQTLFVVKNVPDLGSEQLEQPCILLLGYHIMADHVLRIQRPRRPLPHVLLFRLLLLLFLGAGLRFAHGHWRLRRERLGRFLLLLRKLDLSLVLR